MYEFNYKNSIQNETKKGMYIRADQYMKPKKYFKLDLIRIDSTSYDRDTVSVHEPL